MIKRLRIKFVCINMTIVFLMLCIIFGTVFTMTKRNLERESIGMMEAIAQNPIELMRPDEIEDTLRLPYFSLEIDSSGNLRSTVGGFYDLSDRAVLRDLLQEVMADGGETGVLENYRLRFCRVNTRFSQFVVFSDMSSEYSTMENLVVTCILIGIGSLLVFLVISIALSFWAIKPVEQAFTQQQQFVADASHELKTPLTVILTNAEMLKDEGGGVLADNILTMSEKMKALVESLLDLARVDHGISREALEPVDLSRLVEDSMLPFEPLFYEKHMCLHGTVQSKIQVSGRPAHLSQVVAILLDNALKYAADSTEVHLTLKRCGKKQCLLSVANPGDAISKEDLRNIFKRFYRRDPVRSMNGSYGLGLPIAEGIVEKHRGKIWAESENGINTFFVQLPTK